MMRTTAIVLALVAATVVATPLSAQRADRIAFEAAMDEIPPDGKRVYLSPYLGEANEKNMRGNVVIQREDQARLQERYRAELIRAEHLLECESPREPLTCRMPANSVLYQFVLPDPVDENGILTLRLVRLVSNGDGEIRREAWLMALGRRRGLGWTVLGKELVSESDGPW